MSINTNLYWPFEVSHVNIVNVETNNNNTDRVMAAYYPGSDWAKLAHREFYTYFTNPQSNLIKPGK